MRVCVCVCVGFLYCCDALALFPASSAGPLCSKCLSLAAFFRESSEASTASRAAAAAGLSELLVPWTALALRVPGGSRSSTLAVVLAPKGRLEERRDSD